MLPSKRIAKRLFISYHLISTWDRIRSRSEARCIMSKTSDNEEIFSNGSSFEQEARKVIQGLKISMAGVIDALRLGPGTRPIEFGRALKIDTKLCWKISKFLEKGDLFEAGQYVPGNGAMKLFLEAAARKNVKAALLNQSLRAFKEFEGLVRVHAGSRRAFDMMLAAQTFKGKKRADLEHRKNAFESNGYIWGIQARTHFKTFLFHPSRDPDWLDVVVLAGFVEMRRLRHSVPWRIQRTYSVDDQGQVALTPDREPLDPDLAQGRDPRALPLIRRFCSDPPAEFVPVKSPEGVQFFRLAEGPVGRTAAFSFLTGETVRRIEPRYRHERYQKLSTITRVVTPCETLVFDLAVHRGIFEEFHPSAVSYSALFTGSAITRPLDCDRLDLPEKVEPLGSGMAGLHAQEIPRYLEMLRFVFDRTGWDPEAFLTARLRVQYPPTPSAIFLEQELPHRP